MKIAYLNVCSSAFLMYISRWLQCKCFTLSHILIHTYMFYYNRLSISVCVIIRWIFTMKSLHHYVIYGMKREKWWVTHGWANCNQGKHNWIAQPKSFAMNNNTMIMMVSVATSTTAPTVAMVVKPIYVIRISSRLVVTHQMNHCVR